MTETLFVSDLHLEAGRPAMTELFLRFLRERAPGADGLYILGDLFEVWYGDDGADEHDRAVIDALRTLTEGGTPAWFMRGNRDFLIDAAFFRDTGLIELTDPTVVDLYGTPTQLLHGDSLCTDDAGYMAFRHVVRSPQWRDAFLARPVDERRAVLRGLRSKSESEKRVKATDIMDVNPTAVATSFAAAGVEHMIHGHTHRMKVHPPRSDGPAGHRYVLGDWSDEAGNYLCATPETWRLETWRRD
ncbi:MAG: UDP-2,3-diacylglucosamine diphosphatase [Gammaproteobacteria bacterium]